MLIAKPYGKAIFLCAKPYRPIYYQNQIYKTGEQTGRQLACILKRNFGIYIPLKNPPPPRHYYYTKPSLDPGTTYMEGESSNHYQASRMCW